MAVEKQPETPAIYRYLVRYGRGGQVGRFGSIHLIPCKRGDRVVVHTDRGIEAGEVLVPAGEFSSSDRHSPAGELLRLLTQEDERVLAALNAREQAIASRGRQAIVDRGLPIEIVESESLLDARTTILYFVGQASEELGRLSVELASDPRERVRFEPLLSPDAPGSDDEFDAIQDAQAREQPMKGPYERLKYDFRRVWECPACKRRERTDGGVTSRFCNCTTRGEASREGAQPIPMKLIEDGPRPRFHSRPRWPLLPEEIEAANAKNQTQDCNSTVKPSSQPQTASPDDPKPPTDSV